MQQDVAAGFYTISVLEGGEGALDPLSTATMEQARFVVLLLVSLQEPLVGGEEGVRVSSGVLL